MGKKFVLDQEDGTVAGGNIRGNYSVDLQRVRTSATQITPDYSSYGTILNGQNNQALGPYSTVLGGNTNNAPFAQHNTVINGQNCASINSYALSHGDTCTATNTYATAFGFSANASGAASVAIGSSVIASGNYSAAFGFQNTASAESSMAYGYRGVAYLQSQSTIGNLPQSWGAPFRGACQSSTLIANKQDTLTTAATTVLSLDGTGVTNLIIPDGNYRAWNVQVNWVAIVQSITGTATGISVGDVITSIDLLAFKKIGGISSASTHTSTATKLMVTTPAAYAACAINYTAGASQEMALTFTYPTFVGGGSLRMRVTATIELAEVAF